MHVGHVWHGVSIECYKHVGNVVHVKFDTDHPTIQGYLLFVRVQKLDDECMAWEQDNSLQAHWLNELYSLHSNGPSVIFHWATIIMHTTQLNGGIVLCCCQAAS